MGVVVVGSVWGELYYEGELALYSCCCGIVDVDSSLTVPRRFSCHAA